MVHNIHLRALKSSVSAMASATKHPPHTPHSNGEAERAVQTVKKLWSKAPDKHLALLDYRTAPLESVGLSPAQLFMGRRPRNKLPSARALLKPTADDPDKIKRLLDKAKENS